MSTSAAVTLATEALARVVGTIGDGEGRPGQSDMAGAVARTFDEGTPLIVQAGTGTGKSLAYLVPAVVLGKKVLVATATKALQDQLAAKDVPQVAAALGGVSCEVLKGRQNYVCHQKLDEAHRVPDLLLDADVLAEVSAWAEHSPTGEIAELQARYDAATLERFVTSADECTGTRCPMREACRANQARARAEVAQVVIVNQHLLGADVRADAKVLPAWDVLVVDEAHEFEDVMAHVLGDRIGAGRIRRVLGAVVEFMADNDVHKTEVRKAAERFADALDDLDVGARARRFPEGLAVDDRLSVLVTSLIERLNTAAASAAKAQGGADVRSRAERAVKAASGLTTVLTRLLRPEPGDVVWVEGASGRRSVHIASLAVATRLAGYWRHRPVVLTSATIPPGLGPKVALEVEPLRVASPFEYPDQARFYVAADLPDPREKTWRAAAAAATRRLVDAAGGRALLLFTSWQGLNETLELAFSGHLDYRLLRQDDMDKRALIEAFRDDETSVLAGTRGLWSGIDVPGASLRLVVIDRIPFPVPTEPLHQARREAAGAAAFTHVDVPLAATQLAQGSGRLIRTRADRGMVALMDPRLALRRNGYGRTIEECLPPMGPVRSIVDAVTFLEGLGA